MGFSAPTGWNLRVLGYWQLRYDGVPVEVGARQQRLLAALALLHTQPRHVLAALLWPDSPERQSAGNLRASVFRISHELPRLLSATDPLQLDAAVRVDLHEVRDLITEITLTGGRTVPPESIDLLQEANLLPGWYEEWVIEQQDHLLNQRVDVLDALSRSYLAAGSFSRALGAARAGAVIDPLRESTQHLLVRCHLAENNYASAVQVYRNFRAHLGRELGLEPSAHFAELLGMEAAIVDSRLLERALKTS
ncbi:MAG: bacterial transcriptional activator domain-containing protein [Cryobacterium sp.]|uniref:AfsR/SARP family transcriptional regulator n=1 Tax=unclassified Cryobacterium TaxID=2649013 RepID=UPI0018CBA0BE|nr:MULTISPECIES: bacterial transcriptional activator domain-containing protein [unclassified Cryobacterium]MCY7405592.1 bacterial transcriptional activator domain-containing protein [Cryobacterium sp.]MEC5154383.1 DNA-binding SARP family transcriptional activator [Cryobacterium sp. CAN_C3]